MKISEKQVHYLMDCAQGLLNRMVIHNEPPDIIEGLELTLGEIRNQQSTELKEIN